MRSLLKGDVRPPSSGATRPPPHRAAEGSARLMHHAMSGKGHALSAAVAGTARAARRSEKQRAAAVRRLPRLGIPLQEIAMPRGDKSSYTDKQKRQAEHIESGYEHRGVPKDEAERRAWATVNKETGGGKKSGSGRGQAENHEPSRKGGRLGGKAAASRTAAERSASAKKAAATRKRNAAARAAHH
ncbi:hypothetical protein [Mitsuaria sp. PDC51]|uniref:hypothetical protein n=1 Tax=Mitsuaria sp. PDC51 TaxID=1881035 RepID=UPI0020C864CA|nr:hypothetical protein [Mitsuaria sp. PDC51]